MCELETPKTSTLYNGLRYVSMDILQNYKFDYSFDVKQTKSKLELYILNRFFKEAAIDLQRQEQRVRDFSSSIEGEQPRCSNLIKVDFEVSLNRPSYDLFCVRDILHMTREASCP